MFGLKQRVTVSEARVLVAPNSEKSIVGRDWLIALRCQIKQATESGECERTTQAVKFDGSINFVNPKEKVSLEVQQGIGKFPQLIFKEGQCKKLRNQINMKNDAKISQKKMSKRTNSITGSSGEEIEI